MLDNRSQSSKILVCILWDLQAKHKLPYHHHLLQLAEPPRFLFWGGWDQETLMPQRVDWGVCCRRRELVDTAETCPCVLRHGTQGTSRIPVSLSCYFYDKVFSVFSYCYFYEIIRSCPNFCPRKTMSYSRYTEWPDSRRSWTSVWWTNNLCLRWRVSYRLPARSIYMSIRLCLFYSY